MNDCILPKYGVSSINDLLPHRRSMLMLDGVRSFEPHINIETFYHIPESSIFVRSDTNNQVASFIGFECIAQSIGIYNALLDISNNKNTSDKDISNNKIGFLVSVNNLVCQKPFIDVGTELLIRVSNIEDMGAMVKAFGIVFDDNGVEVMQASISIIIF